MKTTRKGGTHIAEPSPLQITPSKTPKKHTAQSVVSKRSKGSIVSDDDSEGDNDDNNNIQVGAFEPRDERTGLGRLDHPFLLNLFRRLKLAKAFAGTNYNRQLNFDGKRVTDLTASQLNDQACKLQFRIDAIAAAYSLRLPNLPWLKANHRLALCLAISKYGDGRFPIEQSFALCTVVGAENWTETDYHGYMTAMCPATWGDVCAFNCNTPRVADIDAEDAIKVQHWDKEVLISRVRSLVKTDPRSA